MEPHRDRLRNIVRYRREVETSHRIRPLLSPRRQGELLMQIPRHCRQSLSTLWAHKLRSFLTSSVSRGELVVATSGGFGRGLPQRAGKNLKELGSDIFSFFRTNSALKVVSGRAGRGILLTKIILPFVTKPNTAPISPVLIAKYSRRQPVRSTNGQVSEWLRLQPDSHGS